MDLFTEINNAIFDLQASDYQTYERPLGALAQRLHHPELEPFNRPLVEGVDLDAFLQASEATGGGMAGSHKLAWPGDKTAELGLTLCLIDKLASEKDFAFQFSHTFFYSGRSVSSGIHAMTRQLLIPFVRDYKAYVLSQGQPQPRLVQPGSNKVFIVHGHDEGALQALARFLEKLGLEAIILKEQPNQGRTVIEKFEDCAKEVGFAVVLLTPDDLGGGAAAPDQAHRGRQNVIFELGYFVGALRRGRVCLLRKGEVEIPSDLFGVVYTDMDPAEGWKARLVQELKAAKLDFDANRMWS